MAGEALLRLYRWLGYLAVPVVVLLLVWRARHGKEDPRRRAERYGAASAARPAGRLTWIHAASVGEMNAVMDIVEQLSGEGEVVLLTTGTLTSAKRAADILPQGARHAFAPLDATPFVERFLGHWQPDLALIAESEIWPATLSALKRRTVPTLLVNGRISERSAERWRRRPRFAKAVFGCLDGVLASSKADAVRLAGIGAGPVRLTGNLKFDRQPPPADAEQLRLLSDALGGRPAIVAVSTHPGEESLLAEALQRLRGDYPDILLIIVPRHPERGADLQADLEGRALSVCRRSVGETPDGSCDVYLIDTLGEVGLALRLAPFAFIGGTLVPRGGQNPIEAASLGRFVLHGPKVTNFREAYQDLDRVGAALEVDSPVDLAAAIGDCLRDPDAVADRGARGAAAVERERGALRRTMQAIAKFRTRP